MFLLVTMLGLVSAVASGAAATDATQPAPGATAVVCFGDSITARGYPQVLGKSLGVEVANAGVPGQSSRVALKRLKKDVLDRKPRAVVILFGTNDSRLDDPKTHVPLDEYEANLGSMIDQCRAIGAEPVICTIPPIDETAYFKRHAKAPFDKAGGLEKVLASYRAAAMHVGETKNVAVVDLHQLLLKEPQWMSADGVHPTEKGNQIIAALVEKSVRPLIEKAKQ
jgi:lysophospholipase L1-like esterase